LFKEKTEGVQEGTKIKPTMNTLKGEGKKQENQSVDSKAQHSFPLRRRIG